MIRKALPITVFILLFAFLLVLMTPAKYIKAAYGADVTSISSYIESSHTGTATGALAFNNQSNAWYGGETGAGVSGISYIGQDFGALVTREIRRVGYLGYGSSSFTPASFSLDYSDDGANWASCGIGTLSTSSYYEQYFNFDACGTHRYWRLLATANLIAGSYWIVSEIEMFEYIEDPTPTITQTPTSTPLPLSYESTLSSGVAYEIERSATFGEIALFAILAFISVILLVGLFLRISTNANTNS